MTANHQRERLRRRLLETGVHALTKLEIPGGDPWAVREIPILSRAREQLTLGLERAGGFSDVDELDEAGVDIPATAEDTEAAPAETGPRRRTRRELAQGGDVLGGEDPTHASYRDEGSRP